MSTDAPVREHDAALRFSYPDEPRARAVADALAPEVGEIDDARSSATVDRDGETVLVRVAADDLVALRAGINSWSRLVEVAERVSTAAGPSSAGASSASGDDPPSAENDPPSAEVDSSSAEVDSSSAANASRKTDEDP